MVELNVEKYTIYPQESYPFHILANKYTSTVGEPRDGYTLIMLHAVGTHKETWEVTIKRLFELGHSDRVSSFRIRDVYSIECPNHGESAVLNEEVLKTYYADAYPTSEYSRAAHIFLTAGPTQGAKVDFSRRKLVGIGHSIGAAALFCMRNITPPVRFETVIAVEAGISIKGNRAMEIGLNALEAWSWLRRDVWVSRKAALKDLARAAEPWDARVLELFVKHGLRQHPAAKYPRPHTFKGVTTCISKEQECACFRSDELVVDAMDAYGAMSRELPVHLIWGYTQGVLSKELKELLRDPAKGKTPASVCYIEGLGHMAVQLKPDLIAEKVHEIMTAAAPIRADL